MMPLRQTGVKFFFLIETISFCPDFHFRTTFLQWINNIGTGRELQKQLSAFDYKAEWFLVFCLLHFEWDFIFFFFAYLVAVFRWEKSEPVQSKPHIVTRIQITCFWFFKKYSLFRNRKRIRAKHSWEFEMVFVKPRTFKLKSLYVALGSRVASYIPHKCFHDTLPEIAFKKLNV